jgi:hypothetical protein
MMPMQRQIFQVRQEASNLIHFDGNDLLLISQIWEFDIPGTRIVFLWQRPLSVWVRKKDLSEQVLMIRDNTRILMWGLLLASLIFNASLRLVRKF